MCMLYVRIVERGRERLESSVCVLKMGKRTANVRWVLRLPSFLLLSVTMDIYMSFVTASGLVGIAIYPPFYLL